jgi:hypothetical protein
VKASKNQQNNRNEKHTYLAMYRNILLILLFSLNFGISAVSQEAQFNHYCFGLGVSTFLPTQSHSFYMSYDRTVKGNLAIGCTYSWFSEEWTGYEFSNEPMHSFRLGLRFSHEHLLDKSVKDAGLINLHGQRVKIEETFIGFHAALLPQRISKLSYRFALGAGLLVYNDRFYHSNSWCGIAIEDHKYVFGRAELPTYSKGILCAGFFQA